MPYDIAPTVLKAASFAGMEAQTMNPKTQSRFLKVHHRQNLEDAKRKGLENQEYPFVLVDYRNNNEQIKKKAMSYKAAYSLNELLRGSGFGWGRIDSMK